MRRSFEAPFNGQEYEVKSHKQTIKQYACLLAYDVLPHTLAFRYFTSSEISENFAIQIARI